VCVYFFTHLLSCSFSPFFLSLYLSLSVSNREMRTLAQKTGLCLSCSRSLFWNSSKQGSIEPFSDVRCERGKGRD
jgi:hypothetical protein